MARMDNATPLLIRIPELADLLGVRRETLWAWERRGLLPPRHRIGGIAAWPRAEIDSWLAALPRGIRPLPPATREKMLAARAQRSARVRRSKPAA
jgi:predicted DNA-binding transcriptional regulator AlpA